MSGGRMADENIEAEKAADSGSIGERIDRCRSVVCGRQGRRWPIVLMGTRCRQEVDLHFMRCSRWEQAESARPSEPELVAPG